LKIYRVSYNDELPRFLTELDAINGQVLVTPGFFRIGEDYYALDTDGNQHWLSVTVRDGSSEFAHFGGFPTCVTGTPYWVR